MAVMGTGEDAGMDALEAWVRETVHPVAHTGNTDFVSHLRGVREVLRGWGEPAAVCDAGLLHSVYGTEGFQGFKLPFAQRAEVRARAGERCEKLAWVFCVLDRATMDLLVAEGATCEAGCTVRARPELGGFEVGLTGDEWRGLVALHLADWLEQVEGAARGTNAMFGWEVGDAWGYRREAYAQMAEMMDGWGVHAAARMHREVMGREPPASRGVHQPITPPMSEAAREARAAVASRFL